MKFDILHITNADLWPVQVLTDTDQWLQLSLRQAYNMSTQALLQCGHLDVQYCAIVH